MKALVIIPTYNEAATIETAVRGALAEPRADVLVVDDASPDGTADIVRGIGDDRIRVLARAGKQGLGPAYLAGFADAIEHGYDVMVEMDADLSHDPADVSRLLDALEGADVAIGSRYVPGGRTRNWSKFRRFVSRAGNVYARALLRVPAHDATSGFRAYRRAVLESIPLAEVRSEGYAFQVEMTWRAHIAGFAITEIPIVFTERREGASKFSKAIVLEALWAVFRWALRRERRAARHPRSVAR
jgi:glycosyltransferase involved in cell wall biosynthesis